jgi:hypothetical protein
MELHALHSPFSLHRLTEENISWDRISYCKVSVAVKELFLPGTEIQSPNLKAVNSYLESSK